MSNLNRRHFLAASALAGASQVVSAQSPGSEKIATGVIGIGGRGSGLLRGVLAQPNTKVIALCDIKPDRLDRAATTAQRDNPQTYTDYRKLLDRKDMDSVFIATPPYLHSEMAIAALEAGKNVYCEKPIGVTPAQVRDLVRVAKRTKKVFFVGQQMRSDSQLVQAVQQIQQGVIGDILMVNAQRHAAADLDHKGTSSDWYFDFSKSGGYLVEQSVHNLDACNWVIGAHPLRASGFGGTGMYKNDPPGRTIMDHSLLTYEYPNGVKMSFTQMVFHPRRMPRGNQAIHVYGTKGSVDLLDKTTFYPLDPQQEVRELAPKQTDSPHVHITAFYNCVTAGAKSPADITIGATAALTAILGNQAAEGTRIATWKDFAVDL